MDGFEGPTMRVHPQAGSQNKRKSLKYVPYLAARNISTFSNLAKVELHPFGIRLALPRTQDSLVFDWDSH